jgi:hypothetical protein
MAEEMGLKVDKEGFNRTMEEAREKARGARGKVLFFFVSFGSSRFVPHSIPFSSSLLLRSNT